MLVMGISCYYHDSAIAVVDEREIKFAIHEERLSRQKHDPRFPVHAIGAALDALGIGINDLDRIVFYEDPQLKLGRLWDQVIDYWPRSRRIFDSDIPRFAQHSCRSRRSCGNTSTMPARSSSPSIIFRMRPRRFSHRRSSARWW